MNKKELAEQITPEKALSNLWRQKQSELIDKHIIPMYATLRAQSISYFLKDGTVSGSFRQALEDIMNDVRKFIAPQPTAAIIEAMGKPESLQEIAKLATIEAEKIYAELNNHDCEKDFIDIRGTAISDFVDGAVWGAKQFEAMGVQPGMRWVKASERLPEEFKTVLIWDEDNIEMGYLAKNGYFICERIMVECRTVTHWMPLPPVPNNEQNVQVSDTRNDAQ